MISRIRNRVLGYANNFSTKSKFTVPPVSVLSEDKTKPTQSTQLDKINKNEGLKLYMGDIYKKSGFAFAGSLGVSLISVPLVESLGLISYSPILWIANIPTSFYFIYKMSKLNTETKEVSGHLYETENSEKTKYFNMFTISNGITLSPLVAITMASNPTVIPVALACTVGVFSASSLYALKRTDLSLCNYEAPLMGCVGGLIVSGLAQILMHFMGLNSFAHSIDTVTTLFSTAVFSGLVAVNTQLAIKSYEEKNLDSVGMALQLLLDATNLFINLVKLLSKFKNDD